MVMHKKDRAQQAKGVDDRHQEPLLNLSRRRFIAGAGALVIGLTLRGGAATADSTAGGLLNVAGGDATPSLWIANELPRSKLRGIKPPLAYTRVPPVWREILVWHAHLRTTPTGRLGDAVAHSLFRCLAAAHTGE
jgi:hypothetical protein